MPSATTLNPEDPEKSEGYDDFGSKGALVFSVQDPLIVHESRGAGGMVRPIL